MSRSARLFAIGIAVAASACSVVSGWSDLQDGTKADARKGADGSAPDGGSSSGDALFDGGAGGGVRCGATRCPVSQGCCVDFSNAAQCTARQICEDNGNNFLSCTGAASCSGAAPVCCFDFGTLGSACAAGCGTSQAELCEATEPTPCSGGKSCTRNVGTLPVKGCQ